MNKALFSCFSGAFLLFILLGCVSSPGNGNGNPFPNGGKENGEIPTGWYAYAPVQADTNPWQTIDIQFVAAPTEEQRVQAWLSTLGINATAFAFIPHDAVTCDALNCPRGDRLVVQPADPASLKKLDEFGFAPYTAPFVFVSQKGGMNEYAVTLVNPLPKDTLYFGGCNEFIPQTIAADGTIAPLPPKTCVWEGLPTGLPPGQSISFSWNPSANGTYNVVVGYGLNCDAQQPLSQAACKEEGALSTKSVTVSSVEATEKIVMRYDVKQCNSNPWQTELAAGVSLSEQESAFRAWVSAQGLHAQEVRSIPAPPNTVVCTACSCGTGEQFEIVVPGNEQTTAEELNFTYYGVFAELSTTPHFMGAAWYVYTPYQCYANLWNSKEDPVHSVEKDIRKLTEYLEGKGVKVAYTAFVRGVSLSQQCTKKSTDKYGVGVLDDESKTILASLAFVPAGKQQLELFTSTSDQTPTALLYRTKFCAPPPWGTPDLSTGNEQAAAERVTQWLNENGFPLLAPPTIHRVPPSATGTCDTDSGLGVMVNVPAWTAAHLNAQGFMKPSTLFDAEGTQVYPLVDSAASAGD